MNTGDKRGRRSETGRVQKSRKNNAHALYKQTYSEKMVSRSLVYLLMMMTVNSGHAAECATQAPDSIQGKC